MRSIKKYLLYIFSSIVVLYDINLLISLALNKKYVVSEIASTNQKVLSLEGIQEEIEKDYLIVFYVIIINIFLVLLLMFYKGMSKESK
jgi:hypothetical protein